MVDLFGKYMDVCLCFFIGRANLILFIELINFQVEDRAIVKVPQYVLVLNQTCLPVAVDTILGHDKISFEPFHFTASLYLIVAVFDNGFIEFDHAELDVIVAGL